MNYFTLGSEIERALLQTILNNTDTNVRPVQKPGDVIMVNMSVTLNQILDMVRGYNIYNMSHLV